MVASAPQLPVLRVFQAVLIALQSRIDVAAPVHRQKQGGTVQAQPVKLVSR